MAERIPGAKLVELPGDDHLPWVGKQEEILDPIEEFITGSRYTFEPERVLSTIMFTDIVGSTDKASELGDKSWKRLLDAHDTTVRNQLEKFRGREIKTTGDGFLATFDGPARAIQCARSIAAALQTVGIVTRTGVHTGEIELRGSDIGGIAVHIAARVMSLAGSGETLVSRTVVDLVAGSGLRFENRGEHIPKGIGGNWQIFVVV